ncbi:two-component sensor histidine kinase [Altericroceibacterium spongiae]|uniref:histidine kinase n=1 Tax=Altericroceibacterium spongiae TaxID=2320269 RepID=A0A420ECI6_9SPHN|nr:ATP-binding protein [Altericroceibacterium spongiae]RKF18397.1 two-component sensor histidine kinase [Altericroceibacterium spongiae]
MTDRYTIPWPGILLALGTGVGMIIAGGGILLSIIVIFVWICSFWLLASPPVAAPPPSDSMQLTRTGMRDLIEHSGMPLLLMDVSRIIIANAEAREVLGRHIIGQDARVAFRHPAAVDLLARTTGGTVTIQGLTGPRSIWQMTRQPVGGRYWLVELINRTAEADISRAHTDFVANASHELRTPLASIIGYIETLSDEGEKADPKMVAKFHGTVLREARRLQTLVDDLMSLSRVEAEKHEAPSERLYFGPLVQQAARDGAGPQRIDRIDYHASPTPLLIRGDRQQLEQLVRNLVDNALKYGSQTDNVTVDLSLDERRMALLKVQDRGEGIAPEHLPHLTRRFYRTDPGRSRMAGGTGLGLAIVKHIVERHRGRLDIHSKRGEGTTVTVRIPTISDESESLS